MSATTITFSETVFASKGKEGVLPPADSDGYHTLVIGGLNCFNSAGEYYVSRGVIELFEKSSSFQRRVANGALYSEVGHPRKQPGMTNIDYYNRMVDIVDTNICGHFSEITLDFEFGRKHPELKNVNLIGIIGKVKPAGAKADVLERSLATRKQNTAFSVRGITENFERNNRIERVLQSIITFDHVTEPGIKPACKAYAPSLESFLDTVNDTQIDVQVLKHALHVSQSDKRYATESGRLIQKEIMTVIAEHQKATTKLKQW